MDGEGEGVVEVAGLLGERMKRIEEMDFDVGGEEFVEACSGDERVGVEGGDDAAVDASGDQCIRAWAGAAVVGAGLEGDVCGCAVEVVVESGGLLECGDLCVVARVVEVRAFSEDDVAAGDDAADGGIWRCEGCGVACEIEGSFEEAMVSG